MLNGEKYKDEIAQANYRFALRNDNKIGYCNDTRCCSCKFDKSVDCISGRTRWLLEEYKEPILNDEEKRILKDIISAYIPFSREIKYIRRTKWSNKNEYYLQLKYENETVSTPDFNGNELFKGMKLYNYYTLEELGL